jgi:hypothetical protein
LRIVEFSSPFINDVWKFFDGLQYHNDKPFAVLPEPERRPREKKMAQECREYIDKLSTLSGKAGDDCEREFVMAMSQKYPHLTWLAGRKANQNV